MPVVNAGKVTFSAGARVKVKPYGQPDASYVELGLLGADATLNYERNIRQKMDMYPEVPVAVAVRSENASMEFTVREWTAENVALAFGLSASDVTTTTGSGQTTKTVKIGGQAQVRYYTVQLEEEFTNGEKRVITLHKTLLGIRGGLPILDPERAPDLPMVANAVYDPTAQALLTIDTIIPS